MCFVFCRVKCDGCQALIIQTRYKCNVCANVDFCADCYKNRNFPTRYAQIILLSICSKSVLMTEKLFWRLFFNFLGGFAEMSILHKELVIPELFGNAIFIKMTQILWSSMTIIRTSCLTCL